MQLSPNSLLQLIKWPVFLEHVFFTSRDQAIDPLILVIITPFQKHTLTED